MKLGYLRYMYQDSQNIQLSRLCADFSIFLDTVADWATSFECWRSVKGKNQMNMKVLSEG